MTDSSNSEGYLDLNIFLEIFQVKVSDRVRTFFITIQTFRQLYSNQLKRFKYSYVTKPKLKEKKGRFLGLTFSFIIIQALFADFPEFYANQFFSII